MNRVYARLIILGITLVGIVMGVSIASVLSEEQLITFVYTLGYSAVGLSVLALILAIIFGIRKEQ